MKNQFGFSVGGPIARNRSFFFGDYQGTRSSVGGSRLLSVPTEAARRGVASILGECGSAGGLDPADVRTHVHGITNVMRFLGMLEGTPVVPAGQQVGVGQFVVAARRGGLLRLAVGIGETVGEGYSNSVVLADPALRPLTDIFATPAWLPLSNVFSIGDVLISVGLGLAPWGLLQWPIYVLAAMAWITVVQRMLFVRRQLRELAEQTT